MAVGGSLCLLASAVPPALAARTGTTVYTNVRTGTLAPASALPAAAAPFSTASTRSRAVRRPGRRLAAAAPTAAPLAPASALAGASGSQLVNFNGVSSRDSAETNFAHQFEPPDQGLCAGNGFVLEMVNSAYTVFDEHGHALAGPFNVNGPFDEGLTEFTSDPRCYYDAADHTWFATILALNPEETASTLDIAVNPSGDPRTAWTVYKLDTTANGGKGQPKDKECPCFGDQPKLGWDGENIYVATDEFSIKGPQFNGDQIYAFAKKDLVALSGAVHFVQFRNLSIGGAPAGVVQPALTTGKAPAEWFLNSIDPTETFDQRVGVWALSEGAKVGEGGVPKLSSVVIGTEAFGVPPGGEQKGANSLIETGDDRMQQAQSIGGSVWGELTTALNLPGDPQQRSGAAWFRVKPSLSQGLISDAKLQQQGYVAVAGNYLTYPALQLTRAGRGAMVFTITGAKLFPSAAYATLAPEASEFGPVTIAAKGTTFYDPEAERWGDYSFAVLDPTREAAWLATEYVPPKASRTLNGERDWGTRVLEVEP
ncbi:MAG TPA: hypothetical protein VGD00_03605 [Solirubrobacteraceae bacterium]